MSKRYKCIVVAEGEFHDARTFETAEELAGFTNGVSVGASLCGGGSCGVYNRDDLDWLRLDNSRWSMAIARLVEKHLPEGEP